MSLNVLCLCCSFRVTQALHYPVVPNNILRAFQEAELYLLPKYSASRRSQYVETMTHGREFHSDDEKYDSSITETFNLHMEDIWPLLETKLYTASDVTLYCHTNSKETLPHYYIRGELSLSAETVFNTLLDPQYYEEWRPLGLKDIRYLYQHSDNEESKPYDGDILHASSELPWPFTPRDYVYRRHMVQTLQDTTKCFIMVSCAVYDTKAPMDGRHKRVETYQCRLLVRSVSDDCCTLHVDYQDDTHYSIPDYVSKAVTSIMFSVFWEEFKSACCEYDEFQSRTAIHPDSTSPSRRAHYLATAAETQSAKPSILKTKTESTRRESIAKSISPVLKPDKTKATKQAALQASEVGSFGDFTLTYVEKDIGLQFSFDSRTKRIVVAHQFDRRNEIEHNAPKIGSQLISINGMHISQLSLDDVVLYIENSGRPITLRFQNIAHTEMQPRITPKVLRHPSAKLRCTITKVELTQFVSILAPYRVKKTQIGAILQDDISLHTRSSIFGLSKKYVTISRGYVVQKIDGCNVLGTSFADIRVLLAQDVEIHKNVTLYATDAVDSLHESPRHSFFSNLSNSWSLSHSSSRRASSATIERERAVASSMSSCHDSRASYRQDVAQEAASSRDSMDCNECLNDYTDVKISPKSINWAWNHIQLLRTEERLLSITMLLTKIETCLQDLSPGDKVNPGIKAITEALTKDHNTYNIIRERSLDTERALYEFNHEDADWQFAQCYSGISTHWKPGDNDTVWLKMDGNIEGAGIFNILAVIREIDLYKYWAPFCGESRIMHEKGHVELSAYFTLSLPLLPRDAVIDAYGVNACYEHGSILLLGKSVDEVKDDVPRMRGWNADRLHISGFRALIQPMDTHTIRTCIVVNIDLKCPLPKSLLNYGIRKGAGLLHYMIAKESIKIEKARKQGSKNEHLVRIEQDPSNFYSWLRPRLQKWFACKDAGHLPPYLPLSLYASKVTKVDTHDVHVADLGRDKACSRHHRDSQASVLVSEPNLDVAKWDIQDLIRLYANYIGSVQIWSCILFAVVVMRIHLSSIWVACILKCICTFCCVRMRLPDLLRWVFNRENSVCQSIETNLPNQSIPHLASVIFCEILSAYMIWSCFQPDANSLLQAHAHSERDQSDFYLIASSIACAGIVIMLQLQPVQ